VLEDVAAGAGQGGEGGEGGEVSGEEGGSADVSERRASGEGVVEGQDEEQVGRDGMLGGRRSVRGEERGHELQKGRTGVRMGGGVFLGIVLL